MESRPDLPVLGLAPLPPRAVPAAALGHRWDYRFARALLQAQSEQWTGRLEVFAEGVTTTIHLRHGRPVFVSGGLPIDSLGRVLAQRGWITETQLAEVVEHRMSIQGRKRFGEVALELGVLDPAALAAALSQQVCDKVMRCLHWEHGEMLRREGEAEPAHPEGIRLSVEPLLLAGAYAHFRAPHRLEALLGPFMQAEVRLRDKAQRVAQRLQLDAEETASLEAALAAPDMRTFLATRESGDPVGGALLCALALSDQLELAEAAPPMAIAPEPDATADAAALELADNDQFAGRPQRFQAGGLRLLRPVPMPPRDPDEAPTPSGRDKLLADSAFLQGRELLQAEEHAAAADAFKTAAALRPGAREYALHAAWAGYLAAGRSARFRARLEAQCRGALSQDRHLAFAHHVLGQLALEAGDLDSARSAFERAVGLDPNDDVALENLARLPR